MKVQPLARQSSLVVKELEDETLVYDQDTDQAHCLNDTAASVWKHCDGRTGVSEIAQRLATDVSGPVNENIVWLALDQLEKFKLLEKPVIKPAAFLSSMSRRQAVRALGIAAITLPMVTSIIVPHASAVGSLFGLGECCNNPNQCGTNCCAHRPTACVCNPADPGCTPSTSSKQCADTASPTGPTCQDL